MRKTSRLVGVNKNTVVRYSRLAGEHAKSLHDEFVAFSPSDAGGSIRRKVGLRGQEREKCDPDDPADAQQGDNWDHVAFDPSTGWC